MRKILQPKNFSDFLTINNLQFPPRLFLTFLNLEQEMLKKLLFWSLKYYPWNIFYWKSLMWYFIFMKKLSIIVAKLIHSFLRLESEMLYNTGIHAPYSRSRKQATRCEHEVHDEHCFLACILIHDNLTDDRPAAEITIHPRKFSANPLRPASVLSARKDLDDDGFVLLNVTNRPG